MDRMAKAIAGTAKEVREIVVCLGELSERVEHIVEISEELSVRLSPILRDNNDKKAGGEPIRESPAPGRTPLGRELRSLATKLDKVRTVLKDTVNRAEL